MATSAEQIAYEAYAAHQNWLNYQGLPIPPWNGVRPDIQEAWRAAVLAILTTEGTTPHGHP